MAVRALKASGLGFMFLLSARAGGGVGIFSTLPAVLLSACVTLNLPRERVELSPRSDCPIPTTGDLGRAEGFDCNTPTPELECALAGLRSAEQSAAVARAAARVCFLLADGEESPQRRERFAAEGVRWAELAIDLEPENGAHHYYFALNLGVAVREHTALALKSLKHLQRALERACQLSPQIDQGGPLRLLGMLYLLAPAWPEGIGDDEKALELLRRAVAEQPGHPLNHLFLARVLLEEEDAEAAGRHLEEAARLLQMPAWRGACPRWQRELQKIAEEGELETPDFTCPTDPRV